MKITKISPQQKNLHRWNIFVDGDFSFAIDENIITNRKILLHQALTEEDIEFLLILDENWRAWRKSCDLLNRRMYSIGELKNRLYQKKYSKHSIQFAIEKLVQSGNLDDFEYAKLFIKEKMRLKYWGKIRIQIELRKYRITENIIEKAIKHINLFEEKEHQCLQQLIQKGKSKYNVSNSNEKKRFIHWIQRRGYSINKIMEQLNE